MNHRTKGEILETWCRCETIMSETWSNGWAKGEVRRECSEKRLGGKTAWFLWETMNR